MLFVIAAIIFCVAEFGKIVLAVVTDKVCVRFTEGSLPAPPATGGLERELVFGMEAFAEGSLPAAPPAAGGLDGELVFGVRGKACFLIFSLLLHSFLAFWSLYTFSLASMSFILDFVLLMIVLRQSSSI